MSEKTLRAYSVQADESGCVIFAYLNVEARRLGASELGLDFEDIETCTLAPEFDQYAPGPVPVRALQENGWWHDCFNCSRTIHGMEVEDDESGECHEPTFHENAVFCDDDCRDTYIREREERREAKAKLLSEFARRFPGCTVDRTWGVPVVNALAFNFPGGKCCGRWEIESPSVVNVAEIDLPAWREFRGTYDVARWEDEGGSVAA